MTSAIPRRLALFAIAGYCCGWQTHRFMWIYQTNRMCETIEELRKLPWDRDDNWVEQELAKDSSAAIELSGKMRRSWWINVDDRKRALDMSFKTMGRASQSKKRYMDRHWLPGGHVKPGSPLYRADTAAWVLNNVWTDYTYLYDRTTWLDMREMTIAGYNMAERMRALTQN